MATINLPHIVWVNDTSPDLMASNLNANQEALEKCVEVANKFNGIINVINEEDYNYPDTRYIANGNHLREITKALNDKGVESTGLFKNVPNEIRSIESGGSGPQLEICSQPFELVKISDSDYDGAGTTTGPEGIYSGDGLSVAINLVDRNVSTSQETNYITVTLKDGTTKQVISSVVTEYDYHIPPSNSILIRDKFTLLTGNNPTVKVDSYEYTDENYTQAVITTSYTYLDEIPVGVFQTGDGWYGEKSYDEATGKYIASIKVLPGYSAKYGNYRTFGDSDNNTIFTFDAYQSSSNPMISVFKDF